MEKLHRRSGLLLSVQIDQNHAAGQQHRKAPVKGAGVFETVKISVALRDAVILRQMLRHLIPSLVIERDQILPGVFPRAFAGKTDRVIEQAAVRGLKADLPRRGKARFLDAGDGQRGRRGAESRGVQKLEQPRVRPQQMAAAAVKTEAAEGVAGIFQREAVATA